MRTGKYAYTLRKFRKSGAFSEMSLTLQDLEDLLVGQTLEIVEHDRNTIKRIDSFKWRLQCESFTLEFDIRIDRTCATWMLTKFPCNIKK